MKEQKMTDDERAAFIFEHRMSFPSTEMGPYVTELRAKIRKRVGEGMMDRSGFWGGSWDTENHPDIWRQHEERARCILEMEWEIERAHFHSVNLVDTAPIMRHFNTRTMRRYWEFRPSLIRPWLEDRFSRLGSRWRVWRDRNVKNPYHSH